MTERSIIRYAIAGFFITDFITSAIFGLSTSRNIYRYRTTGQWFDPDIPEYNVGNSTVSGLDQRK